MWWFWMTQRLVTTLGGRIETQPDVALSPAAGPDAVSVEGSPVGVSVGAPSVGVRVQSSVSVTTAPDPEVTNGQ